jgi:hypothetical protein
MTRILRSIRLAVSIAVTAATLAGSVTSSFAQTGAVRLHVVKAGFIFGLGGGSGVLHYDGHAYRLSVGGIGIGTIGIAGADLVGTAYNLHRPGDIVGTYGAASASGSFVGGAKVIRLQNEKGVVLELHGVQAGFEATLGVGGMTIAFR